MQLLFCVFSVPVPWGEGSQFRDPGEPERAAPAALHAFPTIKRLRVSGTNYSSLQFWMRINYETCTYTQKIIMKSFSSFFMEFMEAMGTFSKS